MHSSSLLFIGNSICFYSQAKSQSARGEGSETLRQGLSNQGLRVHLSIPLPPRRTSKITAQEEIP